MAKITDRGIQKIIEACDSGEAGSGVHVELIKTALGELNAFRETKILPLSPITADRQVLADIGVNVFAAQLLGESIEKHREGLAGKVLVMPISDHNHKTCYVMISPDFPSQFDAPGASEDTPVEERG